MQTKLEQNSIINRDNNVVKNDFTDLNFYDVNKASQEFGGKGTNSGGPSHEQVIDIKKGGSEIDINGNPQILFSGREGNMKINNYNSENSYENIKIDTSLNKGQVIIK